MAQIDPSFTINATLAESSAALDELQRLGDAAGIRQAKLAIAQTKFYLGKSGESLAIVEELRDAAADLSFVERREIVTIIHTGCYFGPTRADAAIDLIGQAFELVRDSLIMRGVLATSRTGLLAMQGRAEESRAESRRADELWAETGKSELFLPYKQAVGEGERFLGRPEAAEADLPREHGTALVDGRNGVQLNPLGIARPLAL